MGSKIGNKVRRILRWNVPTIVRSVRRQKLTYLTEPALAELFREVRVAEYNGREGLLVEAGCALGGSAIVMATAKSPARRMHVYDVFGMIPPPSENDGADVHDRYEVIRTAGAKGIRGDTYYGYLDNLYESVQKNFTKNGIYLAENNVHLIKGLFEDTMEITTPVAVAHIDGDWYESVRTCLERIWPQLVIGGVLIIDDYESWSGCRKAVDEYFAKKDGQFRFVDRTKLHVVRIG